MNTPEKRRKYFAELQKADVLKHTTKREVALLLFVLSKMPGAKKNCEALVAGLRGESWSWIEDEELLDSALVIFAIYNYHKTEIDGVCLAHFTNKMLANEVEVGGPYYGSNQEVDILTNFVISKLFNAFGSPLPNVEKFLKSRRPLSFADGNENIIYGLLQSSDPEHVTSEMPPTMPFLAEALTHKKLIKGIQPKISPIYKIVSENVYNDLQNISSPIKDRALIVWKMINQTDTSHEITEISKYFANSLLNHPKSFTQDLYVNLGMANFYVWMAYTIYDDLIDEEGQIDLLPVANIMLRKALGIYAQLSHKNPLLLQEIFESFDKMDEANSWELAHCRYEVNNDKIKIGRLPAYSNYQLLANRAWGHILGPVVILSRLQITTAQRQMDIQKGLEHFLIAKQLSDDLHDWNSDFQKGHISTTAAYLLKAIKIKPGLHSVSELTKRMQEYFWSGGVKEINKIILRHLAHSKRYFKKSALLDLEGEFFIYIFGPLAESVRENELKYIHQQQFLTAYSDESRKE